MIDPKSIDHITMLAKSINFFESGLKTSAGNADESDRLHPIPEEPEDETSTSSELSRECLEFEILKNDFRQELKDLEFIEQDFFSFVLPWLKLIPEGASVPLEEVSDIKIIRRVRNWVLFFRAEGVLTPIV